MEDYKVKLEKLIENRQYMDKKKFKNLAKFICENNTSSKLLDVVLKYLENCPHQIPLIPKNIINVVIQAEKPLHPLFLFLASQHDDIDYDLDLNNIPEEKWAYLMSAFYQRCPLMICDPVFVLNIKNRINVFKMLIDSPLWFNENGYFFMGLHAIEFDQDECDELFSKLKADWSIFKITQAAVSFVDLVAAKCNKELEFIQFLILALFSLPPESNDVPWLSTQIINNLKLLDLNSPIQISDWDALTKKALKHGLEEENPKFEFIKVFRKLIKKSSVDKIIFSNSFNLLTGHSQFSNIMLSREANQLQKEEVLRLIEILVKKELSLMSLSHVPFFLCSYNASLSVTDQLLLRILFFYEENSIPMSNYRPYLWGSFAVSHYQVKNHVTSKTLHSFPSTTEVLSYVPLNRLKETISCFPVDRILHIKNQKIIHFDTNGSKNPSQMLDPAFFLPMISSILATEAPLSIEKFTRTGCLSMVVASLGSCDAPLRLAAYHILTLLRSHLFCRRAENMLWDHFITWVAHGIQDLNLKPPPQLSMIQSLFLARMVLAIANHEKGIEATCCKVLLARPNARLNHIPELKTFLTTFNVDVEKTRHVHWVFEIIRDGIRSSNDWPVLKDMDLFNNLIVIYSCGSEKTRILILKIMEAAFRVQPATNGGTGPLALSMMVAVSKFPNKLTPDEVIQIFKCLRSLSKNSCVSIPAIDFCLMIFTDYGTDPKICLEGLYTLNNLVTKYPGVYKLLKKSNVKDILCHVENTKVLSDDELFKCQSILENGFSSYKIPENNSFIFLPTMISLLKTSF